MKKYGLLLTILVLCLCLTLLLIQTRSYAFDWQFVTTSDGNDKVYIDKNFLRINKYKINYFAKYVRQDGSSFVDLYSCNYKEKYSILLYVTEYNKDGSIKGKKYMENSVKEYIVPGSVIDKCLKTAIEIMLSGQTQLLN